MDDFTTFNKKLYKWMQERGLDKQEFNFDVENLNCFEEILELYKVPDARTEAQNILSKYDKKSDLTEEDIIDSLADRIIYSIGAIYKLGYNPDKVLEETYKEINSRTGKIIDGKFTKDTSEEAKARWYKADYKKTKDII